MNQEQAEAQLAHVRAAVAQWRRSRTRLSPMPEALWKEASAVARLLGVTPVARALGLNSARLGAHVGPHVRAKQRARVAMLKPPRFLEVRRAELLTPPLVSAAAGPVVELSDAHGVRLAVRLPAGASLDVPSLVAAFRR